MHRRTFLTAAATGFAATAGCLGESDPGANTDGTGDDATDTPTPDPTATPTQEPASVERVSLAGLQPARIALGTPDSIGVFGESAGQSLFISVQTGSENPPARSDFAFELDGKTHTPVAKTRRLWRRSESEFGAEYSPSGGWLLFDLPATADDPDSARLRWPGGSWQPDPAVRTRLASQNPTFDVSVTAPETVPVGETPEATVAFENTSDVAGTFVLAVNRVGPYIAYAPEAAVRNLLEPGASGSVTVTPSFFDESEIAAGDTTQLKFDWYGGETSREIAFVAPDAE
ncbi:MULTISPECIES: hypothetical protein [Salinibaculum]|uniref:hypothetical protein n=1 Tax=Salinibaculum TaxID=2732368 RepID=UPI0030CC0734